MTQPETEPRAEATTTFNSRLYAGMIGSGKSVSIGHDIRTLLDAEREYRIIDLVGIPGYDRQGLEAQFGTFCDIDEAGYPTANLYDALQERPYVRVDAEHGAISEEKATQRIRHVFEHASATAKESEYPTVVAIDALPRGADHDTLTQFVEDAHKHGVAVWTIDQEPFQTDFAEKWVSNGGEVVLHNLPRYGADSVAKLSDADREHVSTVAIKEIGENPVLVGSPGNWEHETVPYQP